jgi:hypothetical protein
MLRRMLNARPLVAMIVAAGVGVWGLSAYPLPMDNVFLELIALRNPPVFHVLAYTYATVWFTTPFLAMSLVTSMLAIVAYHHLPLPRAHPLPRYPQPESRSTPTLVLGEAHFASTPGRSSDPTWLTIPQRGLYTGVMIFGAVGTGKTSACMYPYVDQLVRFRADDPDRKLGGLVLEVKGDFCHQVRSMLAQAGRQADYLEVGLDTGVCYNPLHNDLDPYAVGNTDPTGDERAFALSRQARLIPIVATQSISSLRSALTGDESWRTLLQCFRTKLFLATSDEFTAGPPSSSVGASTDSRPATRSGKPAKARTCRC